VENIELFKQDPGPPDMFHYPSPNYDVPRIERSDKEADNKWIRCSGA